MRVCIYLLCFSWLLLIFFSLQYNLIVKFERLLHNRILAYNIATFVYGDLKNKAVVSKDSFPFQALRKISNELTVLNETRTNCSLADHTSEKELKEIEVNKRADIMRGQQFLNPSVKTHSAIELISFIF